LALSQRIHRMNIERVFVITVPHITVLPIIRGVGTRSGKYYPYYTRPWIWDSDFDPARHSHLTQGDIERIDGIIDEYNAVIRRSADGYGWHIVDFCGFMDESAFGRNNGTTRVPWPPEAIAALRDNKATGYLVDADGNVHLDIRYFRGAIDKNGSFRITTGGLIGLDGMHPTVLFYALMAHHVLQVMITTGVRAEGGNIPRVDWASAISSDTLLMDPPVLLADLKRAAKLMAGSFFNTMEKLCFTPNQLSTPAHKPS
ncbi:MAG TPA: hypothetical protein VKF42_10030, partial [Chitinivibrionales bacterium]|nr:hypothetical protein [Chitinivibrionales bacterium]